MLRSSGNFNTSFCCENFISVKSTRSSFAKPYIDRYVHTHAPKTLPTEKKNLKVGGWNKLTGMITVRDKSNNCFSYEKEWKSVRLISNQPSLPFPWRWGTKYWQSLALCTCFCVYIWCMCFSVHMCIRSSVEKGLVSLWNILQIGYCWFQLLNTKQRTLSLLSVVVIKPWMLSLFIENIFINQRDGHSCCLYCL